MVLANKVILVVALCFSIFGNGLCANIKEIERCVASRHEWTIDHQKSKIPEGRQDNFSPIYGIRYYDGKIWMATYSSDYFAASLVEHNDRVKISGLKFRYAPPGVEVDTAAGLVRKYEAGRVDFFIDIGKDCSRLGGLVVVFYASDKKEGVKRGELVFNAVH